MKFYWRKKAMGRILRTGASGNVGKYVAQYALKNRQEITVAGTHTDMLASMFKDVADIVYFDFTDPNRFQTALKYDDTFRNGKNGHSCF